MTQYVIADFVNTQLAAAASSSATTLTLANSTNLPTLSAGQVMPLILNDAATGGNYEIVYVTAITGVTLTVTRAQEGTGALSWNVGDYAYCGPTSGTVATVDGNPNNAFAVAPPTAGNQAIPASQAAGVVGASRNLSMNVPTASATATLTADEIIVETALGGFRYCLPSFSKTINLATTGAGGMDTGTAPSSGFVALYAIYNPTTQTSALLATNATSAVQPNVYGGANMPSGYTASALVSVWRTSASGQFTAGTQIDRDISVGNLGTVTANAAVTAITAFTTTAFPKNAKKAKFYSSFTISAAATVNASLYADASGTDQSTLGLTSAGPSGIASLAEVLISTPQTVYYNITVSAGTVSWAANLERYTI
jgi:hypothetical protein